MGVEIVLREISTRLFDNMGFHDNLLIFFTQVRAAVIPDSKTLSLRLLLVAKGPVKPRSAATLGSLRPPRLIVWSTLLREAPDLTERLGPTKME